MRRRCSRRSPRAACAPPALIPWVAFCSKANATILSIVASERAPEVLAAIRETCQPRTRYLLPVDELSFLGGRSRDIEFGPGRRRYRLRAARAAIRRDWPIPTPPAGRRYPTQPTVDAPQMLVAAIVHSASASPCLQALLAAGYRVTRINTVGGFLRRGYPALLTGVTPDQVDHAIGLLRQACRQRSADSTPGIAFVLPGRPVPASLGHQLLAISP